MSQTESDHESQNVTFRAPERLVNDFEEKIWSEKVSGDVDREANRSDILRELMESFCENGSEIIDTD